jgi:hypothetical protein
MISNIMIGENVEFPENTGERIYMMPFTLESGLPEHVARWQGTIDSMIADIDTDETMYLMVDQGLIKSGDSHRRGGAHIDGNWIASNDGLIARYKTQFGGRHDTAGGHRVMGLSDESIILASDVSACNAYSGEFIGSPKDGGDCSHIDISSADVTRLEANKVYTGNVTMIHESLQVEKDVMRTLVRINVPKHKFN